MDPNAEYYQGVWNEAPLWARLSSSFVVLLTMVVIPFLVLRQMYRWGKRWWNPRDKLFHFNMTFQKTSYTVTGNHNVKNQAFLYEVTSENGKKLESLRLYMDAYLRSYGNVFQNIACVVYYEGVILEKRQYKLDIVFQDFSLYTFPLFTKQVAFQQIIESFLDTRNEEIQSAPGSATQHPTSGS